MSENKYYTPDISEFRIGFEYEAQDLGSSLYGIIWRKEKYQGEELRTDELERKELRVKQLDTEDIESLGFEKDEYSRYVKGDYKITLYPLKRMCIFKGLQAIFMGFIKNKSELQVLLKQLS